MEKTETIDSVPQLVHDLEHEILRVPINRGDSNSAEQVGARLRRFLAHLTASGAAQPTQPAEWRRFVHFNEIHYTRNLIHRNAVFELMVVCWRGGQISRIHSHGESHCWAGVLDGVLREHRFNYRQPDGSVVTEAERPAAVPGECPTMQCVSSHRFQVGEVTYINDSQALHSLGAAEEHLDSISLHLYSPPLLQLKIFEPEAHRSLTRKPGFYSINGERT